MTSVCIVAGEASGDKQAARLVHALKNHSKQNFSFWGVAGPDLRAAGVEAFLRSEDLAVMGLVEVLSQYLNISSIYKKLRREIEERMPDLLIVVDYPGFNMRLIQDAYALGIKVIYHIPPKVWAHGKGRMATLAMNTHLVTCVLPFEEKMLRENRIVAKFVGNPLFDACVSFLNERPRIHRNLNADEAFTLGLCPGSRRSEINSVLPTLVRAFEKMRNAYPRARGLIPIAATLSLDDVKAHVKAHCSPATFEAIEFSQDAFVRAVSRCDYAWVCSGTATLETAFLQIPHSIVYRMNPYSYWMAEKIVRIPYIGLANWCAGRKIVPEFLQSTFTIENIVQHAEKLLFDKNARDVFLNDIHYMTQTFPRDAENVAAQTILQVLGFYPQSITGAARFRAEALANGRFL